MESTLSPLFPVFSDLVRAQIQLWNALDSRLRTGLDVTLGRFETMQVVASTRPCRVLDVADQLVITIGGASKLVDRVEALGHCRRSANPDDRRSSLIGLTAEGEEVRRRAAELVEDELRTALGAVLPAADLDHLARTVHTLRHSGRPTRRTSR